MSESVLEFVGGLGTERERRARGRRMLAAVLAAVALVILLGGAAFLLGRLPQPLPVGASNGAAAGEPSETHAFAQALQRFDPRGMRAEETATCISDQKSSLCFGPESDSQFKTAMRGHTIDLTFIRRYQAPLGTVVLYDMLIRNQSTGRRDDLVLVLRLAANGKIDHALVT